MLPSEWLEVLLTMFSSTSSNRKKTEMMVLLDNQRVRGFQGVATV